MRESKVKKFRADREQLNETVMKYASLHKRDSHPLILPIRVLLLEEALSIGMVVGGSITIPHLRRALQVWDELRANHRD